MDFLAADYFVRRCTPVEGSDSQWSLCRSVPERVIAFYETQGAALADAVELAKHRSERTEDAQVHLQGEVEASRFKTYWHSTQSSPRFA